MNTKKRILIISQHFWPESFRINDICDFLIDKNCEIDVLCGTPNYPKGKFFEGYSMFRNRRQTHNGANIRRVLEVPRGNNTNFKIFANYISFPIFSLFHIPYLLTKKYDKIFLYQTSPVMMTIAGLILGKIKRVETTLYVLDLWPENLFSVLHIKSSFLIKLATSISHWHYKKADKLIVLSERMKQRLITVTDISPDKIITLVQTSEKIYETNIIDKKLSNKFKNGFNILFAGNISPAQSFETILEAAKNLKDDGINNINWIIVGDGMSRKWLEDQISKLGMKDSFYFEGQKPIEDIPKYTAIADVLVACLVKSDLLDATIPAKVMSYIAAGKPIVLAMDGEAQSLINNTIKCGFAGPAGDAKALYDNINKIYHTDSKDKIAMGERARKYHFKHFERNIILNKLYNFIFDSSRL